MTEETYRTTHAELCSRFEETEAKLAALQKQRDKMKADAITIGGMMFELGELDTLPVVFDEKLWHSTIDHVTVQADERVVFHFKDGHLFRFALCLLPVVILFGFEFVPHALTFQSAAILLPVATFDKRLTARLAERNIGFAAVVIQRIGIHRHKAGKAEICRIHHRFNHGL